MAQPPVVPQPGPTTSLPPYGPPPVPMYGPPAMPPTAPGRPWYKKKRFIIPLVLVALIILGSAIGSGDDEKAEDSDTASAPREDVADVKDEEPEVAKVIVPDFEGMTGDEAQAAITAAGLSLDTIRGEAEGAVVKNQYPAKGTSVDEGSTVDLTLAVPVPTGTRDDPFPPGTVLSGSEAGVEVVTVSVGQANWAADSLVMAENQFNDVPPAGSTYVLVPVTITNIASEEAVVPWLAVTVAYVAPDGRSFDEASAVIPNEMMDYGDLYIGGSATGNLVYVLPTDVQGGVWAISYGWFSDPVFVTAH